MQQGQLNVINIIIIVANIVERGKNFIQTLASISYYAFCASSSQTAMNYNYHYTDIDAISF